MSKIVASVLISLAGLAGYTLSDSTAVEVAGLVVTVSAQLAIYVFRILKPDVSGPLGLKKR